MKSTLDSYTSRTVYTPLTVSLSSATCDCSHLRWTNPSADSSNTVAVGTPATLTVPVPTADTSLTSTVNVFEKCYQNGGSCPTTGHFAATTGITDASGNALPSWITYTTTNNKVQTITVSPTDGTHTGTHTLLATFTSDNGPDPNYTAFVITVTCAVTSFTAPSNPSNVSYSLFSKSVTIDLTSLVYTQTPACGYTPTNSLTWTGTTAFITTPSDFVLNVYSQDISHAGNSEASPSTTYTMTLKNDLTLSSNGPSATLSFPAGV